MEQKFSLGLPLRGVHKLGFDPPEDGMRPSRAAFQKSFQTPSVRNCCPGPAWQGPRYLVTSLIPGCWLLAGSLGKRTRAWVPWYIDLDADGFASGVKKNQEAVSGYRFRFPGSGLIPELALYRKKRDQCMQNCLSLLQSEQRLMKGCQNRFLSACLAWLQLAWAQACVPGLVA